VPSVPLVVVPDPDDPECADVLVDVTVDGRRYRMVLDTGAAHTHLVADARTAELPVVTSADSAGALAAGRDDLVRVSGLEVGPIRVDSLDVVRVPGDQPGGRHLLGMDVLAPWSIGVRLAAGRLEIAADDGPDPPAEPRDEQELEMDARGHSYVALRWPGASARACWDTGAGITVVDESFAQAHPQLFADAGSAYGMDSTGAQVETPIQTVAGPERRSAFRTPPGSGR
jgi:predicted aspartyl protease